MDRKWIIRYGLLSAAILIGAFTLSWVAFGTSIDYRTAEGIGYLGMLVALSMIFFGIKAYRDRILGGAITFGQAFRVGFYILLFPSLAFFLFTVAFFYLAGGEFFAYMEAQMPPEQLEQYEANKALFSNPWFQGLIMLLTILPIGLGITLVSAMLLRRPESAATPRHQEP